MELQVRTTALDRVKQVYKDIESISLSPHDNIKLVSKDGSWTMLTMRNYYSIDVIEILEIKPTKKTKKQV